MFGKMFLEHSFKNTCMYATAFPILCLPKVEV